MTARGTAVVRSAASSTATNSRITQVDAFTIVPSSPIEVWLQMPRCRPKARNDAPARARNSGTAWRRNRTSGQGQAPVLEQQEGEHERSQRRPEVVREDDEPSARPAGTGQRAAQLADRGSLRRYAK